MTPGATTSATYTAASDQLSDIGGRASNCVKEGHVLAGGLKSYRAEPVAYGSRALKPHRTLGSARMASRNIHKGEREHGRQFAGTFVFKRSTHERRKVELLFAH
jgi:hypothetical protein